MGTWLNSLVKPELLYANQPPQSFGNTQDAINAGMAQIPPQDPGLVNTPPANVSLTPPLPSSPGASYGVMQGDQNPAGGTMPPNPAPPGMAISGGGPQMPAPNPMGPLPLFNRPTFEQATTDQYGDTKPPSAPLTKLGMLLSVMQGAMRGGSAALASGALNAAPGKSGFGSGWAGAQNEPLEHAGAEQQLQHGGLENQQLAVQTKYLPEVLRYGFLKDQADINAKRYTALRGSSGGALDTSTGTIVPGSQADLGIAPDHLYGAALQDFQATDPTDPAYAAKAAKVAQLALAVQATKQDPNKPISKEQAAALNATWDPIAQKSGLPAGQFTEGMPSANVTQLQTALNGAIGKQQGATKVVIQQQAANNSVDNATKSRADKSYQYNSSQLDKYQQPVEQLTQRLGRLQDTLDQHNPQADALVGPELLTVMAGGQGSGLRMNEAEISRVVGGRSAWQNLQAAIQHWNTNPADARSITPAQDQQIRALVGTVQQKLLAKGRVLDGARQTLINSDDPEIHRQAVVAARAQLDAIDAGQAKPNVPATTNPLEQRYQHLGAKVLTQ